MLGTIPKTFSNDTLDLSSVDSMSLDEHIEIKIPEARARENRLMAQNNFIHHINEKCRNSSHTHLAVENGQDHLPKHFYVTDTPIPGNHHPMPGIGQENRNSENKDPQYIHRTSEVKEPHHIHRNSSNASIKKAHGLIPNGVIHAGNCHNHIEDKNIHKK